MKHLLDLIRREPREGKMAIFSTPCAFFGARSAAMRPEKPFGCGKNSSFFPPRRPAASSLFYAMLALSVLAFSGCRKDCDDPTDPDCANYDPCTGYVGADAGFEMFTIPIATMNWTCDGEEARDLEFAADTIFGNNLRTVHFRANQEDATKYEWKIGADPRTWTTRELNLDFGENAIGDVRITLMVEKVNPFACGGTPRTRDTLTKVMHVLRAPSEYLSRDWSLLYGKWLGYNEEEPELSFEIEIIPNFHYPFINGLFPDCANVEMEVGLGRKFMYIKGWYHPVCKRICGIGMLQPDHSTLVLDYTFQEEWEGERFSRKFIGTRVE